MNEYSDSIWVGNYGWYNEGYLVGDWLELPFDSAALSRFLIERCGVDAAHEEVGIFDTDLSGPLGELGVKVGEYVDFESLNMLSEICESHLGTDFEAVRAYMDNQGSRPSIEEYANAVLLSDEIPFYRWQDDSIGYSSDEEHLAYQMVNEMGGIEHLPRETLERHFDFEQYGRTLAYDLTVSDDGYLDPDAYYVADDYYDAGEIRGEAAEIGAVPDPTDAKEIFRELGVADSALADIPEGDLVACAALVNNLATEEADALRLHSQAAMSSLSTPYDYANAAMQIDDIMGGYESWDPEISGAASSDEERVGLQWTARIGGVDCLGRDTLERYFDYGEWGREVAFDVVFTDGGYLDCQQDGPNLGYYSREELMEEAGLAGPDLEDSADAAREAALSDGMRQTSVDRGGMGR